MRLINLLSGFQEGPPCVLGLGTFDGVHLGHQRLIRTILEKSRERNLPGVIFTFDHSPKRILEGKDFPGEITTPEEKFSLLLASGVDKVVFRPFDAAFATVSPQQFIADIIIKAFQARLVLVGFNFGFGVRREGNAEYLATELRRNSVETLVLDRVSQDGETISSTNIRRLIQAGNFSVANRLLGREAAFSGVVIHGEQRGRTMGFPTANLSLADTVKVLPPHGVYLCLVDTPSGVFPAITNIGIRPTFNKTTPLLETHLLDFHDDLYHRTIRVRFLEQLRQEVRFPDMNTLVAQIREDQSRARVRLEELQRVK
jgi:riboflavin kinase/FMN adenylyltransferase